MNVSNHVTCETECVADVVFLNVHVEGVEKELNGLSVNVSTELETLFNSVEDAGLETVKDLESDCETELISVVTNDLHALNSACPESFLIDVSKIIGPVVVASTDKDLTVELYHLVEDAAKELNACSANCGISGGDVLVLGRAEVSGDLKTEILSCNAELLKLSVAHVKKVACTNLKDVEAASLCSLAKLNFNVKIIELSYKEYKTAIAEGNFEMYLGEIKVPANMNISQFFTPGSTVNSALRFADENEREFTLGLDEYRALLSGSLSMSDFCRFFESEMPFIPICYRCGVEVYSRDFSSQISGTCYDNFYNIDTWSVKTEGTK